MAEKYIALSGYCKENKLSISKDFNIETDLLPKMMKDDFKISGYKFKESTLDKIVPDFGFKEVVFRPSKPKRLYILEDEVSGIKIVLQSNNIEKDKRAIIGALSHNEELDLKTLAVIETINQDDIVSALLVLENLYEPDAEAVSISKEMNLTLKSSRIKVFCYWSSRVFEELFDHLLD